MKAFVYEKAQSLEDFAMQLVEVAEPALRDTDVLVEVRAIGVNPGDTLFRRVRSAEQGGGRVLLGWEFAGIVIGTGPAAPGFQDRRPGLWQGRHVARRRMGRTLGHRPPDAIQNIANTLISGLY